MLKIIIDNVQIFFLQYYVKFRRENNNLEVSGRTQNGKESNNAAHDFGFEHKQYCRVRCEWMFK